MLRRSAIAFAMLFCGALTLALYVADSLSGSDRTPNANPITAAEGMAADIDGNAYGAVVPSQMLQKHVRR